jgi:hypothetical protein
MLGAMFVTVGTGLIYTMGPAATAGQYIGYQVLAAIGSGLVIQLNVIVAQAITPRVDMSMTLATVLCESTPLRIHSPLLGLYSNSHKSSNSSAARSESQPLLTS